MSASNGRSFYQGRRTTNTTPRSAGVRATPTGATPTRSNVDSSINNSRDHGRSVRHYGPGQDLLDFELFEPRDSSSSEDGGGYNDVQTFTSNTTPLSRPRVPPRPRNDDITNLLCLMQQQQATLKHHGELLEENLRHQQAQSHQVNKLEEQMLAYEEKLDDLEVALNEPPKKKIKIKVTRDLSVS